MSVERKHARRQPVRLGILMASFLMFPVTIYYFSPYLSVMGAFEGVAAGCIATFGTQFAGSLFLRRAFCGWLCPSGGLQELEAKFAGKPFVRTRLNAVKYAIWVPWLCSVVAGAILAGGIRSFDPLYHTFYGISVADINGLVIYLVIVMLFFVPNLFLGRRAMCHTICWMAPFMVIGGKLGKAAHLPQLHVRASSDACVGCGACDKACPMSLHVQDLAKGGSIASPECIQCGACCDACKKDALELAFGRM